MNRLTKYIRRCTFLMVSVYAITASANEGTIHELIRQGDLISVAGSNPTLEDLDGLDEHGNTPLHIAVEKKDLASQIFLLLKGANPKVSNLQGETALDVATKMDDEPSIKVLSAYGSSLNTIESQLERRLHLAILRDDLVQVGIRLLKGEDVHTRDPERQWTPLHVATINGSHEQMRLFIALGAEVNVRDSIGQMPLHFAAESGDVKALQYLIRSGADVNAEVKNNQATALQLAVLSTDIESVRLLLDSGADPNSADMRGWSAIHIAALKDLGAVGSLLIEYGADTQAVTLQAYTAQLIATASENYEFLSALNKSE